MTHNEAVIRHAFEQAVLRLARLSLFADRGEAAGLSYTVTERQEQLAVDDCLHLAISLRRLIDALALRELSLTRVISTPARAGSIKPVGDLPTTNLHELLNKIIHSQFIELYAFSFQVERDDDVEEAYKKVINKEDFRIDPLIAVRSDRGPVSIVSMNDFCLACDEIIEAAEDHASEQKIYLSSL